MKCENENRCDVSQVIKRVAKESNVSEDEVREAVKRWLNENYKAPKGGFCEEDK